MLRPRALAPTIALLAALALAGCGSGEGTPRPAAVALVSHCPGAVGPTGAPAAHCPYRAIRAIGRRGEGVLRCPEALAFAPDGTLYVGDQFSHLVQHFTASGRFLGQWGAYGSGPGQLGAVDGIAVSARGDVYVLDSTHDRIERFSSAGRSLGEWGTPGHALGQFDFGAGQGPDKPPGGGIAVGAGHVYVADSGNDRVVRYDLDGSHPLPWGGGPGSAPGQFSGPRGLTVSQDVVYVADEGNHRVQALDLSGRPLYAEGTFGKAPGQFVNPFGVVAHAQHVYVVDDNNNRIAVLTRSLRPIGEWSGEGDYHLSYIRAAAADAAGRIYVADTGNERVVAFDATGRGLLQFGTPGITPGQLIAPLAVAANRSGEVLVGETFGSRSPVYLFGSQLRYRTVWERGGGAIIGSHWFGPSSAAFAADGSVWIADPRNDIARHLSPTGAFLGTAGQAGDARSGVAARGAPGGSGTSGGSGNPGGSGTSGGSGNPGESGAAAGELLSPEGVAVAPDDSIYVADSGHRRIAHFSASGRPLATLGAGLLSRPLAVAVAPSGNVYVADAGPGQVVALAPGGAVLGRWTISRAAGQHAVEPDGIAVDAAGHLFVADRAGGRIVELGSHGHPRAAWGVSGAGAGELSRPASLAVDCRGEVLVADTQNNRVQVFLGAAAHGRCARTGVR